MEVLLSASELHDLWGDASGERPKPLDHEKLALLFLTELDRLPHFVDWPRRQSAESVQLFDLSSNFSAPCLLPFFGYPKPSHLEKRNQTLAGPSLQTTVSTFLKIFNHGISSLLLWRRRVEGSAME